MEVDRFFIVAQTVVGIPQIAQGSTFSLTIADFPRNGQVLLMEVDRFFIVAQTVVGTPQIAQGSTFSLTIASVTGEL